MDGRPRAIRARRDGRGGADAVAVAGGRGGARRQERSVKTSRSQAAAAAVKDAKPMSGNGYKVQIARTAVKRAILKASGAIVV